MQDSGEYLVDLGRDVTLDIVAFLPNSICSGVLRLHFWGPSSSACLVLITFAGVVCLLRYIL